MFNSFPASKRLEDAQAFLNHAIDSVESAISTLENDTADPDNFDEDNDEDSEALDSANDLVEEVRILESNIADLASELINS